MNAISFSLSVTFPIFSLIVLGAWLRHRRWIDEGFVQMGSQLVFNFGLPTVLFLSIANRSTAELVSLDLIVAGCLVTLVLWGVSEWIAKLTVTPAAERGVVVQGVYRSNMGIIGLAYCMAAYGDAGVQLASLYLAIVTTLFNVIAVITLSRSLNRQAGLNGVLSGILRNPLILAIMAALIFAGVGLELPGLAQDSATLLASMALPLALICTGGSISWQSFLSGRKNLSLAVLGKLVLAPALAIPVGLAFQLSPIALGVLIMMVAAPTAVASYVMVRGMGGNAGLSANIVSVTTVLSMGSVTAVLAALRSLGLI